MKWLALLALIGAKIVQFPAPVVETGSGAVRGRLGHNGKFYQYFGIPYGTVNKENRFQAPLPPPKWEGILEAVNEHIRCPQKMVGPVIMGTEDCLTLNIYSPVHKATDNLPVMVYIHGGCFFEGTGSPFLYGGDFFTDHGVVLVGINYRLNVEGFLCLGIKEAPGNAGLKDQIAALRWIKQNIAAFGGDPDNVTLFGESAGAVSTSYLIQSPAAKGLFHKAILQSGSSLAPWAIQHDPIKTASTLAKEFGYNTTDPHELYSILSNKSVTELIHGIKYSDHKNYITSETLFVPCIESSIADVEPVITEYPADVIASGNYTKVPMIIGFNDNEGIYFVAKDYGTSLKKVDTLETLPPDLVFTDDAERNQTAEQLRQHYFSANKDDLITDMVDLYSDVHFKFPSVIESEMYAKTTDKPIYYYLFKYSGFINMPKISSLFVFTEGASHADELFYMFKPYSIPMPQRYFEDKMIERMLTMWTNFAKYSDPTPQTSELLPVAWKPNREWNPIALVIDEQLSTAPMWHLPSVHLWNQTYTKHRKSRYSYGFR